MPDIIRIDRSTPFNPVHFLGEGWSIWKGSADGDGFSGEEDQDARSLALTEIDLSLVRLETCLEEDESYITCEERQRRLKEAGFIRLDAQVFQYLWDHKEKIPEIWKERMCTRAIFVSFDGTGLRSPNGNRVVLCLYWSDGEWDWDYRWLDNDWSSDFLSAVLASLPAEVLTKAG